VNIDSSIVNTDSGEPGKVSALSLDIPSVCAITQIVVSLTLFTGDGHTESSPLEMKKRCKEDQTISLHRFCITNDNAI